MCGIVGIVGNKNIVPNIMNSLEKLEYRGYDSSGIVTAKNKIFFIKKSVGKLEKLKKKLEQRPIDGRICIGHTRWATHGMVNEKNAHPLISEEVAVVHNGIIENHKTLKNELEKEGHNFTSDTDSEVISQLCLFYLNKGFDYKKVISSSLKKLEGAFAFCVIFKDQENQLFFAKRGSPLVIGYGENEMFVSSDPTSLIHLTQEISYLEDYDWGYIENKNIKIYGKKNLVTKREIKKINLKNYNNEKGNYRHFMLKEIFEQPSVLTYSINQFINIEEKKSSMSFPVQLNEFKNINKVYLVACGTAYIACLIAKNWLNIFLNIPVEADFGSEFRYRTPQIDKNTLCVFVSQSGETADTLASLKYSKKFTKKIFSIVNNIESSISRDSLQSFPIKAGPEIGVASTKAFTCQLVVLFFLSLQISRSKNLIDDKKINSLLNHLEGIPSMIVEILNFEKKIIKIAKQLSLKKNALFVGRGLCYPLSLEGALKLKEVSYIHAEGYAAGELKHGPIALIDKEMPIIFLISYDDILNKVISNLEEVKARGGKIIVIADIRVKKYIPDGIWKSIYLPHFKSIFSPFLFSIPLQLIAYHTAVHKGTDVDQPRNLAKSVTVE